MGKSPTPFDIVAWAGALFEDSDTINEYIKERRLAEIVLHNLDRYGGRIHVSLTGAASIAIANWGHTIERKPYEPPPEGWLFDDSLTEDDEG